jgi:hypothetical protein
MKWYVGEWTGLSWLGIREEWRELVNTVMNNQIP